MVTKQDIINDLTSCEDEREVMDITEKYSPLDTSTELSLDERQEIYFTGIARWGELVHREGQVVGFEVRNTYAIDALVLEYSHEPVKGYYKTTDVMNNTYPLPDNKKVKGIKNGLRVAFNVVYKTGKALYRDKFNSDIAKVAFLSACPIARIQMPSDEHLSRQVTSWFVELEEQNKN
jgi:hypothetical protein